MHPLGLFTTGSTILGGVFGAGWGEGSIVAGEVKRSLICTFACFWTAIARVQFLEGGLAAGLCLHSNLRFS